MNRDIDTILLTLKKWNLPQSIRLGELPLEKKYGDYISFHTYNFLDITHLPPCANIVEAYKELQRQREACIFSENKFYSTEIRVLQSLTLFGKKTDFWDNEHVSLSITMIQRHKLCTRSFEDIISEIEKNFGDYKKNIAIYFSLDFCDIVLFSSCIPFSVLQETLWELTVGESNILKDTITFPCIEYSALVESLQGQKSITGQDDKVSYAIDLHIHSSKALDQVVSGLREKNIEFIVSKISGRFDIRITTQEINFNQYIDLTKIIDDNSICDFQPSFGGYEITPLIKQCGEEYSSGTAIESGNYSYYKMLLVLRQHYEKYINEIREHDDTMTKTMLLKYSEIYRALCSLSKSTFSDEFVLSVFPALMEFEKIIKFYLSKIKEWKTSKRPPQDVSQNINTIKERLYSLQDDFFRAINMVMQCTMHGEKQFIQAPSLELTLFDIPPKLLVFYSSAVYSIVKKLNDGHRSFSFLISPDFRNDIHVKPISGRTQYPQKRDGHYISSHPNKLSIIYLDEEKIYNPNRLLALLCHEVAHYVGDASRKRKERAKSIFNSIAMYLLCTMTSLSIDYVRKEDIDALAEELGALILNRYEISHPDSQKYLITDLSRFLNDEQAIHSAFSDPKFKTELRASFCEIIYEIKYDEDVHSFNIFLDRLSYTYTSDYITKLIGDEKTRHAGVELLAGQIVHKLEDSVYEAFQSEDEKQAVHLGKFSEILLQSYSEAYADLRMIELLGERDFSFYYEIAEAYLDSDNEVQKELRFNSIRGMKIFGEGQLPDKLKYSPYVDVDEGYYLDYAESKLIEYLSECHMEKYMNENVLERYKVFQSEDLFELFNSLNLIQNSFEDEVLSDHCSVD